VAEAGYDIAFTVDPGVVERGAALCALPRIEVLAGDGRLGLAAKLAAARWPEPLRRRALRMLRSPART
jgi:hypothetical protein